MLWATVLIALAFIPYFPSLCDSIGIEFESLSRDAAQIVGPLLIFPAGIAGLLIGGVIWDN